MAGKAFHLDNDCPVITGFVADRTDMSASVLCERQEKIGSLQGHYLLF